MSENMAVEEGVVFDDKPGVIVVSEADRLRAENVNLRLMNASQRITLLQAEHAQQLQAAQNAHAELNVSALSLREELSSKYGVNFDEFIIRSDDGVVIPRPR